ncbi:Mitochondrial thiamine pyrophosphate carrier 1 [Colletotrichum orbiculare MAFF 240422]|uniref:Mitochondrial thiamine pyrophosphate carrier 1 n=3 Tax=Colletotrichum orbiculare species complex TaxID=2707354 RepID=N4VYJ2_COLOR|nr:Mitochondrial thiamine pyrophosphate carrier 1 [Colletotrichum orbiculare MAFF 240422]TDZ33527.1 Mitochondrial thiamine pyrophosphate carrier 1 [Colletotrichum spinosum]TDZ53424.1 Mitochondrial thiamine pyrophosphate carrier 1 [Colletotrichum trifolii]
MSPSGERLKDEGSRLQVVTAGATAGLLARFVIAPLDVVKIRLQLQTHSLSDPLSIPSAEGGPVYKGTLNTIKHILANEGLTGLWKGNVPAELLYVCYSAVQFTTYRSTAQLLQSAFDDKLPHAAESFISGAAAGAAATTATYPLDLLRTRFAAQGNERIYNNLRHAVTDIYRDEGARGFFRGLGPGVAQIVPYMGIFFALYEGLRLPLGNLQLPWGGGDATAGVVASVLSKTAVFPLDLVRKRIQVQGPTRSRYVHKNIPEYPGAVHAMRIIFANEGVRGLYRGLTVSLIKAAPGSAITVWTYERVLRIMMRLENSDEQRF